MISQIGIRRYFLLFFVTLITLVLELLLTRIFSVISWYHFSFMAISIALFGMTAGAVYVYLSKESINENNFDINIFKYNNYFSISILLIVIILIAVPFITGRTLESIISMSVTFTVLSVPFFFSGVLVSLFLTKIPNDISKLYFVDLLGAGIGCFIFIILIDNFPPMKILLLLSLILIINSFIFFYKNIKIVIKFTFVFIMFLLMLGIISDSNDFRIKWIRGKKEIKPEYIKWNPYSRVIVKSYKNEPFGWGLSSKLSRNKYNIRQKLLVIDSSAGTVLTNFKNIKDLEYLKYDITNIVHYLRKNAKIFIIGVGGGRDVLSALVFNQKEIVGVEINKDILNILKNRYSKFTNYIYKNPVVKLVNAEARSYITRVNKNFDIIQSSLIDTYAASSSGAFALTENSLYTVEAWKTFLLKLEKNGILTFSRWWRSKQDAEILRLTSLAINALRKVGINENLKKHIFLIKNKNIGTILISKTEFSNIEENIIKEICTKMNFKYVLGPNKISIPIFSKLLKKESMNKLRKELPIIIDPPTDNNPFFFQILKVNKIMNWKDTIKYDTNSNITAIFVLFISLIIVMFLSFFSIILPIYLKSKYKGIKIIDLKIKWGIAYFIFIGLGFMFVEISQLNHLSIFLGNPTYGLSVVLFTILIFSGLGSYFTKNIKIIENKEILVTAKKRLKCLLISLFLYFIVGLFIWNIFRGSETFIRVILSILMLSFISFFMGMAFPLGMKIASLKNYNYLPWFWGINGALSVLASVLALFFNIFLGIRETFFLGIVFYLLALFSLINFYKKSIHNNI